ncbi:MAG TPA: GntR family transcriptional regulator [Candidatus Limnocylindrales bacterium]|nr:GntR family transcriptional regulator [Candidatus Limnocylindrales bacterium]
MSAVVADDLRQSIEKRTLGANGRLPSEPELARRMGVSRATIRQAVTELEEAGFVRRRQGRGTFVTGQATSLRNNLNVNSGVTDLIAAGGWTPGTTDVTREMRGATREEAEALGLRRGDAVVVVRRTRLADGRPVVAVEDVLSADRLASASTTPDALVAALATQSLYDVLDGLGLAVHHGIADIRPARAGGDVARRLDVTSGSLVVLIEQIDFTVDDEPVLFSRERHRPDVFQFRVYRRGPGSRR